MTKQKIRRKRRRATHYNPDNAVQSEKHRKALWGDANDSQVKDGKPFVEVRSDYLGSVITAENRRTFMEKQKELYIQNYYNKTEEESQLPEETVSQMAEEYAVYQVNKENKHYKAWLKGKLSYSYKGTTFPVLTKSLIEKTSSVKEIVNVKHGDEEE